ncbi:YitT family protein [Tissierella pigra]|uniref:YitT family protein n=1 Tax=Tissierella pigra TaxID=2607614 RepID=A0A6N7XWU3_9FIRM|nr:YitT family protein [Tissierella pigra]MBU5427408.1 YitT family protein [Tissierella pigra]MSU00955.1 YitT family protein [Tissierella pigra]
MNNGHKWYKTLFSYILITIGVFLMSVSLLYFLAPNTIAPGGVTGFAVVLEKVSKVPIYLTNLAINIPLFLLGAKTLGKDTAIKTLYATFLLSLFLKFLKPTVLTHDFLLSSIFGGVLMGIGLGIVFKFGGTTGGTDLAGSILNKKFPNLSVATFMTMIDFCVVIFAGIVEKNIEISLYSVIAMFVIMKVIDMILEGIGYLKGFYIVTDMPEEVSQRLMVEIDRGVTALKGKGMYTKADKDVLLCVVSRSQFSKVKEIVKEVDPFAFIMVSEMSEVVGEGFTDEKKK